MVASQRLALILLATLAPAGLAATAAMAPGAVAEAEIGSAVDPASTEPFARLRFLDPAGDGHGASALRADGYREQVFFNSPLFQGDRLRTDGGQRAELQLPDGTLIRLDRDTEIEFVAFRDPAGRFGHETLLALHRGNLHVDLVEAAADRDAFRLDTFACSVYPLERASFRVDLEPGRVSVSVIAGAVEVAGDEGSVVLEAGYRTTVEEGGRPRALERYNVLSRDPFGRWIEDRYDVYAMDAPPGDEYEEIPEEVQPYYGELSRHGRWVWVEDYGYCWTPVVAADWRPYYDGYWAHGPGGPVWVSYEPWGWATYRYGRWSHAAGYGWVWIPGRVWSGAWVAWHYGPSYVGWCPLGYWGYPSYVGFGFSWGHHYYDHHPWVFVSHGHHYYHHVDRVVVRRKHHLKRDLDDGVVVRRAVRTDRGGVRRDVARRVRDNPRSFERVARDRSGEERGERRSFRERERDVLSRRDARDRRAGAPDQRRSTDRRPAVSRRANDESGAPRGRTPTRSSTRGSDERSRSVGTRRTATEPRTGSRARAPARDGSSSRRKVSTRDRSASDSRPAARPSRTDRSTPRARSSTFDSGSRERLHRLFREANQGSSSRSTGNSRARTTSRSRSSGSDSRAGSSRSRSSGSGSRAGSSRSRSSGSGSRAGSSRSRSSGSGSRAGSSRSRSSGSGSRAGSSRSRSSGSGSRAGSSRSRSSGSGSRAGSSRSRSSGGKSSRGGGRGKKD
jgi:hypothetical protein